MTNEVLDDIKKYAINKLNDAYGYCSTAENDKFVSLITDDKKGNCINIIFKEEDE